MATRNEAVIKVDLLPENDKQEIQPAEEDDLLQCIEKLDPTKFPEVDLEKVKQVLREAKAISILVTGKTGAGKSTLVNGILGLKVRVTMQGESIIGGHEKSVVAEQGHSIVRGCTTEVNEYITQKGSVNVMVWDSPGLQDGTEGETQEKYIAQMKAKCGNRDLTIYCIKISDTRFVCSDQNPDVCAMKQFTRAFGPEFWSNTIIALTFANTLEAFNPEWEFLSPEERAKAFNTKISEWEDQIRRILTEEVQVGDAVVTSIKIVPVGHYLKPHLPAIPYWLSNFWCECFSVCSPTARAALLKINAKRFKQVHQVKPADLKKKPEDQPIVVNDKMISRLFGGLSISTSAFLCGLAGAGLGAGLGILGGPIGVAVTVPVGFVIGAVYGGLTRSTTIAHEKAL